MEVFKTNAYLLPQGAKVPLYLVRFALLEPPLPAQLLSLLQLLRPWLREAAKAEPSKPSHAEKTMGARKRLTTCSIAVNICMGLSHDRC